jgi:sugar phosphate isomerase/epimerase
MQINIATFEFPLDTICPIVDTYQTGIEIQQFIYHENLDKPETVLAEIEHRLSQCKYRSMHGPFFSLNPSAYDPMVRDAAMHRYRQAQDIGKELSVRHMVLHTGYAYPFVPDTHIYERFGAFWQSFLEVVQGEIQFHIENMFEKKWEYLRDFVASVDDPRVSACLDIGHVNVHSAQPHAEWIKGLGDTIRYVHLHNNLGERDDHNGLGNGTIPIREVLDLLLTHCPNAVWTVETYEAEQSLEWLEEKGYI